MQKEATVSAMGYVRYPVVQLPSSDANSARESILDNGLCSWYHPEAICSSFLYTRYI